jgi:glycosyltransferase involved in cell wall biosynthesis
MRILLASFIRNDCYTGMGKWTHRIASSLSALGHTVTTWFADDFPILEQAGRLSVLGFPVILAGRICRQRSRYDAVVLHEPSGFWYGILRRLFPSLPTLIVMCHNVEKKVFEEMLRAASLGLAVVSARSRINSPLFRHWQSKGALQMGDHIICLSKADQRYLVTELNTPPARVTVMTNGVAEADFQHRPGQQSSQGVLFMGGWLDIKGRRILPKIWSKVHRAFPKAQLTLLGPCESREDILKEFKDCATNSITTVPRVSNQTTLCEEFARHDIFLMPSVSEGCPLSLLEAMASELPVVAASVGAIPDLIEHGVSGLLFDSLNPIEAADHVCALLANPLMASLIGRAGQEQVRNLSWTSSAKHFEAAISKALHGTHTGLAGTIWTVNLVGTICLHAL